jgi:hypothetical protein
MWGPQSPETAGPVQAYRDGFAFFTAGKKVTIYFQITHDSKKNSRLFYNHLD